MLIAVALTIPFIGFNVLLLWSDHMTSGKYKNGYGEVALFIVFIVVVVGGFSDNLVQGLPLLVALALGAVIQGISYAWYCGPLKNVRRRRVEKLRVKWQKELGWLERQDEVLDREAFALGSCSSTTRNHNASHNAWRAAQNKKEREALIWKMTHIVP